MERVLPEMHLVELVEALNGEPCILFLGAGPSIAAGGQNWLELTSAVAKHFQYS